MATPPIQWYPGHIAQAQRQLQQQLQRVDVVLEVLDARIPLASRHPDLDGWIQSKPRVVILNKSDCVSSACLLAWQEWFSDRGIDTLPTDAKSGDGVKRLKQMAQNAGQAVNQRRRQRGMKSRPIRTVVLGFPNVGKSALLNRLVGRRVVDSARKPGVTRQLRWVRLGADLDVLDSPGILPPKLTDQAAAVRLAICDDIGQAAYTFEHVAAAFIEMVPIVEPNAISTICQRYQFDSLDRPGIELVHELAERRCAGETGRAAQQILTDYRKGVLGALALEYPATVAN